MVLSGYSMTALVASIRLERDPSWLAPLGLVLSAAGFLLTFTLIWANPNGDILGRLTFSVLVLVIALAHAALLLPRRDGDETGTTILRATFVASTVLTTMIIIPILFDASPGDFYYRLLGVVAVLTVLGTLLVPILRRGESEPPAPLLVPVADAARASDQAGLLHLTYRQVASLKGSTSGFVADAHEVPDDGRSVVPVLDVLSTHEDPHEAMAFRPAHHTEPRPEPTPAATAVRQPNLTAAGTGTPADPPSTNSPAPSPGPLIVSEPARLLPAGVLGERRVRVHDRLSASALCGISLPVGELSGIGRSATSVQGASASHGQVAGQECIAHAS